MTLSIRPFIFSLAAALCLIPGCAQTPPASPAAAAVLSKPATGLIPVQGGRVWYQVQGRGHGTPLLVLHGGPGIPHDYLENLDQLGTDRPVIFYDQLGCGKSDHPTDTALWTRERFAKELDQVRSALGLSEVILYGHSWGTILAVDYVSGITGTPPTGIKGLILAGPALDLPRWAADALRLIDGLPPSSRTAILEGERTGQIDTQAYKDAAHAFYARHVCRLDPWPEALTRAMANMGESVYLTMSGPNEFTVTGSLKGLDLTPKLPALRLPTLYICGQFDEATPNRPARYAAMTPGSSVVVIPGASHLANHDNPAAYFKALRAWLNRNHF